VDDVAGLLRTCLRSKWPTLFLEPKALYNSKSSMTPVPEDFEVPFGVARTRKEGKDLTVLTYGNTVHMCLEAAARLEAEGFNVEVIDLRSIVPLDVDSIVKSVKKTGRCLIVHEDKVFGGFGGELVSVVNEKAFEYLDAPVKRIGSTNTPVGFNRILEKAILPNTDRIYTGMLDLLKY